MKCARQIVAGLIAASIVLAGCSQSNNANGGSPVQSPSGQGSSPNPVSQSSVPSSAPPATTTSAATSTANTPAPVGASWDGPTKAWFGAVCQAFEPVKEFGLVQAKLANDPVALKAQVVPLMAAAGTSLIASADKINAMAPPNVADGPEMARGVPHALRVAGEALKNDVGKLASASDADAPKVLLEIQRNLPRSPEAMKAFDKAVSSESTMAEMMQIPVCAKLLKPAG